MPVTHVITYNGSSRLEVPGGPLAERAVRRAPELLDGESEFAISLTRRLKRARLRDDLPSSWPRLFLQAAGSAHAMMVEVRAPNPDGSDSLYRLARRTTVSSATTEIVWNTRVDTVPVEEVFDAAEAGEVFWHYYQYGSVPEGYDLRFLE